VIEVATGFVFQSPVVLRFKLPATPNNAVFTFVSNYICLRSKCKIFSFFNQYFFLIFHCQNFKNSNFEKKSFNSSFFRIKNIDKISPYNSTFQPITHIFSNRKPSIQIFIQNKFLTLSIEIQISNHHTVSMFTWGYQNDLFMDPANCVVHGNYKDTEG